MKISVVGPTKSTIAIKTKASTTFMLLSFWIPLSSPRYTEVPKIQTQYYNTHNKIITLGNPEYFPDNNRKYRGPNPKGCGDRAYNAENNKHVDQISQKSPRTFL